MRWSIFCGRYGTRYKNGYGSLQKMWYTNYIKYQPITIGRGVQHTACEKWRYQTAFSKNGICKIVNVTERERSVSHVNNIRNITLLSTVHNDRTKIEGEVNLRSPETQDETFAAELTELMLRFDVQSINVKMESYITWKTWSSLSGI